MKVVIPQLLHVAIAHRFREKGELGYKYLANMVSLFLKVSIVELPFLTEDSLL